MNTQTTLSVSDARKQIFQITKQVQKPSKYYTLTEKGKPIAVIMSAQEYESLMSTLEVMSDSKAMKDIKRAEKELAEDKYDVWDDIKDELLGE